MQQIDADSVKVIIDTNALMTAEQFGVDIFGELLRLGYVEWLVPAQVKGELRSLADGADKGRDKTAARVALGLAERCTIVARKAKNLQTGEEITVPASWVPAFKAGKGLKDSVK